MEIGLNAQEIRELLDQEEWQDTDDPMRQERCIFLGTVFQLYPSGKYYMPWACSNVTEEEAEQDEEWREAVEAALDEHGMYLTSGEGDPCDVFASESRWLDDDVDYVCPPNHENE